MKRLPFAMLLLASLYGVLATQATGAENRQKNTVCMKGIWESSPFPFDAHKAASVDITHVRRANPKAIIWDDLSDAKFFVLPGGKNFSEHFSAFGWYSRKKGKGFFVADDRDVIILSQKGAPSGFAAIDLQADGDLDIVLHYSSYGNHGNGSESEVAYINGPTDFKTVGNIVQYHAVCGQECRSGKVTWVCDKTIAAVFEGEELEVTSREPNIIQVGKPYRVTETYLIGTNTIRVRNRTCEEIAKGEEKWLTYR